MINGQKDGQTLDGIAAVGLSIRAASCDVGQ